MNTNYQTLFTKLFEGGEAKLTFTESEDPLEAGLEIFACPPGKRLQSLALLSGGEQALTAMALIFACSWSTWPPSACWTKWTPPLDDANVERFCKMLSPMAQSSGTRFLVITHHALTMSRMDRLFGVTMAERGSPSWCRYPGGRREDRCRVILGGSARHNAPPIFPPA